MSFQTDYNLLNYSPLIERSTAAMMKAARDILNEDPLTANHENRLAWATSINDVNAAKAEVLRVMVWIAANPTISSAFANTGNLDSIDDNAILYTVNTEALPRRITGS